MASIEYWPKSLKHPLLSLKFLLTKVDDSLACDLVIGCDIVDLAEISPPLHKRFINRAFSNEEIDLIGSNQLLLWRLWAAKEAAFKAAYRLRPGLVFSPKQFEYKPDSYVYFQDLSFSCHFIESAEYVYAYCLNSSDQNKLKNIFNWIEDIRDINSSPQAEVRRICRQKLSALLAVRQDQVEISESGAKNGPTTITIDGSTNIVLVSFSHDGRFVACSALLFA